MARHEKPHGKHARPQQKPAKPARKGRGLFGLGHRKAAQGERRHVEPTLDLSEASEEAVAEQPVAPAAEVTPRGERIEIPHDDGSTLRALLLAPEGHATAVPAVLWIHGDDPSDPASKPAEPAMAALLADHCPCVVLCLDHPAGVRDCHLALTWLRDHARAYGIASDQLMVGGEGSGANLAIMLGCYERDEGLVSVCYQLPLYPSLSASWRNDLSGISRARGYRGLPSATTIVGMDDFTRDETIAFVEEMRKDGVKVDFHMYRGHFSGTGMWADTPGTREAKSFVLRQFDAAVAGSRAPQPRTRRIDVPSVG